MRPPTKIILTATLATMLMSTAFAVYGAAPQQLSANPNTPTAGYVMDIDTNHKLLWDPVTRYTWDTGQVILPSTAADICIANEIDGGQPCVDPAGACNWSPAKEWYTKGAANYSEADLVAGICIPARIARAANNTWAFQYRPAFRLSGGSELNGEYTISARIVWLKSNDGDALYEGASQPLNLTLPAACVLDQSGSAVVGSCVYSAIDLTSAVVPYAYTHKGDVTSFRIEAEITNGQFGAVAFQGCHGCTPIFATS